ncbi:MAG: DUF4811 domain-containing protein [Limosilactobacillus pontis]|uniref:DUF4811 domain-containing protein n=1 Tax=Limosilactobacillus pontis TaxID=35787 RepID=A0A2J6NMS0_9LACO|nr:DUF4811 domain-containing protein [Limosilactobacillus pontis]PMB82627.1 DUF4811 domain-containing protein [Limosilactobacillus pontis]
MVIILTFLGAVCFFLSIMFVQGRIPRIILATITGLVFIGSTALMTLNYSHHFGMHQVTTTTSRRIYPVNAKMPLALYQPVGTSGKDDVYIYKAKPTQTKPSHTQANEYTHSQVKWKQSGTPRLVTTTTRWRFKNNFYKILYAWSGMDGTLVKRTNTLEYPRAYVLLTTKQAKQLQARAKSPAGQQAQAMARQQGQAYVTGRVQAAMVKNPHMTAAQIRTVAQQAEQEFQAKMVRALLK